MMPRRAKALLVTSTALVLACGSTSSGGGGSGTVVVVGIQGEEVASSIQAVHYTVKVPGQPDIDKTVDVGKLPIEEPVTAGADTAAQIDVKVDGLLGGGQTIAVERLASTHFVADKKMLLRVRLEARCEADLSRGAPTLPPCAAPQTCIGGVCEGSMVTADALETYAPNWPPNGPDICKPAGHGAPTVLLGTGQQDYLPITDGETVHLEKGPQGGHHVWTAVRMRNLKQSGSVTTVSGVQPGTGLTVPSTGVVFTYSPDEGGYCKLFGITFRLDSPDDLAFYKNFLGKPLDMTVTVKDASGDTAQATAHVNVAPLLVCLPSDADPLCQK
jgi:hypothetical protein